MRLDSLLYIAHDCAAAGWWWGIGGCSADDSQPQRKQKSPRQPACPQRPPIPTSILNFIGSLNVQLFWQLYTYVPHTVWWWRSATLEFQTTWPPLPTLTVTTLTDLTTPTILTTLTTRSPWPNEYSNLWCQLVSHSCNIIFSRWIIFHPSRHHYSCVIKIYPCIIWVHSTHTQARVSSVCFFCSVSLKPERRVCQVHLLCANTQDRRVASQLFSLLVLSSVNKNSFIILVDRNSECHCFQNQEYQHIFGILTHHSITNCRFWRFAIVQFCRWCKSQAWEAIACIIFIAHLTLLHLIHCTKWPSFSRSPGREICFWLPFSWALIISDRIIGDCILPSFIFDYIWGLVEYGQLQMENFQWISCNSDIRLQEECNLLCNSMQCSVEKSVKYHFSLLNVSDNTHLQPIRSSLFEEQS